MSDETAKLLAQAIKEHAEAVVAASENIERGLRYFGSRF